MTLRASNGRSTECFCAGQTFRYSWDRLTNPESSDLILSNTHNIISRFWRTELVYPEMILKMHLDELQGLQKCWSRQFHHFSLNICFSPFYSTQFLSNIISYEFLLATFFIVCVYTAKQFRNPSLAVVPVLRPAESDKNSTEPNVFAL